MGAPAALLGELDDVVASAPPSPDRPLKSDLDYTIHTTDPAPIYPILPINSLDTLVDTLRNHAHDLQTQSSQALNAATLLVENHRNNLEQKGRLLAESQRSLSSNREVVSRLEEYAEQTRCTSNAEEKKHEKACQTIKNEEKRIEQIQQKMLALKSEISTAEDDIQRCIAINTKICELEALLEQTLTVHNPYPRETTLPLQENEWSKIPQNPGPDIDDIASTQDYSDLLALLKEYAKNQADLHNLRDEHYYVSTLDDHKAEKLRQAKEIIGFLEALSATGLLLDMHQQAIVGLLEYFQGLQIDATKEKQDSQSGLERLESKLQKHEAQIREAQKELEYKLSELSLGADVTDPTATGRFCASLTREIQEKIALTNSPQKQAQDFSASYTPARADTPLWNTPLSRTPSEGDNRPGSNLGLYFPDNNIFSPISEVVGSRTSSPLNPTPKPDATHKAQTPLAQMQLANIIQAPQPQMPQKSQVVLAQTAQAQITHTAPASAQNLPLQQQLLGDAALENAYETSPADDEFAEEVEVLINIKPSKFVASEQEDVRPASTPDITTRKVLNNVQLNEIQTQEKLQKAPKTSVATMGKIDDVDYRNNNAPIHSHKPQGDHHIPDNETPTSKLQPGETYMNSKAEYLEPISNEYYLSTRRHRGKNPLSAIL